MRDIVIANKNKYIYNGKLYDDISIKRVISKEIELYVMEEDLLIKTYDEIKNDKEDIVYEIINEEYVSEKSALLHYEYDKKRKKLFLYSIGNGERIQFLCEDLNEVIILPIQFYIRDIVIKKIKKIFNYIVLIEIKEVVYYLEIKNKLIVNSLIKNKEDFTNDFKFNEIKKEIPLIIDKSLDYLIPKEADYKIEIVQLNIGDKINEKIFKI